MSRFFSRHEWIIPLFFALLFVAITLPGIEWGIPNGWNPDELIQRVIKALHGEWVFDQENFTYPSLPKYVMFYLGRVVLSQGYGDAEVMWAGRAFSVLLGAGLVAMTYAVSRRLGSPVWAAGLAGLIVLSSGELAQQARYAHNDIYLAHFVLLTTWSTIRLAQSEHRGWFYLSCLLAGMAASSKYNGGAVLLAPLAIYGLQRGKSLWRERLQSSETLALGLGASAAGFVIGTPTALTSMSFYFKRLIPTFQNIANYNYRPGASRGLFGQFNILENALGGALFLVGLGALAFVAVHGVQKMRREGGRAAAPALVVPLVILAYDLPIVLSYTYISRYFLPLVPLFAIAVGQFIQWAWERLEGRAGDRRLLVTGLAVMIVASSLRVVSVGLLFHHDARIAASEFLAEQGPAEGIEYTIYPPAIDRSRFERAHNLPLHIIENEGEPVPEGKIHEFNTGLAGLKERGTEYLIIDSLTANRFNDEYICDLNTVMCELFRGLATGDTEYELIGSFAYELPDWLPQMRISFMNPKIDIYRLRAQE